jgi:hypothetical protein
MKMKKQANMKKRNPFTTVVSKNNNLKAVMKSYYSNPSPGIVMVNCGEITKQFCKPHLGTTLLHQSF